MSAICLFGVVSMFTCPECKKISEERTVETASRDDGTVRFRIGQAVANGKPICTHCKKPLAKADVGITIWPGTAERLRELGFTLPEGS